MKTLRALMSRNHVQPTGWEVFEHTARLAMWILVGIVYSARTYL